GGRAASLVAHGDVVETTPIGAESESKAVASDRAPVATASDAAVLTHEIAMPLADIDPMKLSSDFNDLRGGLRRHHALDIMAARGTPVRSAAAGRVLKLFTSKA